MSRWMSAGRQAPYNRSHLDGHSYATLVPGTGVAPLNSQAGDNTRILSRGNIWAVALRVRLGGEPGSNPGGDYEMSWKDYQMS